MEIGKLIKELRQKKGMTQEELAEKTEVSVRTIQRIENGEVDPRAYTLQMIAKALEVDFSTFVENKSEASKEVQKVSNNIWFGFIHLSGVVPFFFPTILIWNLKKMKINSITEHFKAVISFQFVVLGILVGGLWVYWKTGILTPFIGALLISALISIFNTIQAFTGSSKIINPFYNFGSKNDEINE